MKEISIVVPVYNVEKYIGNFIKSVKYQTYKNFELLLINDGSTDKTMAIAQNLLKDSDIDYKIFQKENGGQSSARNLGINEAKGNWIVIPDSDDVLQPNYLEDMYNKTKKENVQVIICDINNVTDEDIFKRTQKSEMFDQKTGKEFFIDFILHRISIGPISLMVKHEFIDNIKLRFNEESRYSEEFIFITKLLYHAGSVIHIKEKLYNYCLRKGSVSTGADIDRILNGYNKILEASVDYKDNNEACKTYNKFAHPRWILATARFTAANMEWNAYAKLMKKLNAKKEINKLLMMPNIKVIFAAILFLVSMKLFYLVARK